MASSSIPSHRRLLELGRFFLERRRAFAHGWQEPGGVAPSSRGRIYYYYASSLTGGRSVRSPAKHTDAPSYLASVLLDLSSPSPVHYWQVARLYLHLLLPVASSPSQGTLRHLHWSHCRIFHFCLIFLPSIFPWVSLLANISNPTQHILFSAIRHDASIFQTRVVAFLFLLLLLLLLLLFLFSFFSFFFFALLFLPPHPPLHCHICNFIPSV